MLRSFAHTTLEIGRLAVPVKMYTAIDADAGLSFRNLCPDCHLPLQQTLSCATHGEIGPAGRVKGFEVARDRYVPLSKDDLDALKKIVPDRIRVIGAVAADRIPRVFQEKFFYLGTDKGGDEGYATLQVALTRRREALLAKQSGRGREWLVMIAPLADRLVLYQLHYAAAVRPITELPKPDAHVRTAGSRLMGALLDSMQISPRLELYRDEAKDRAQELIAARAEGAAIVVAGDEQRDELFDLETALRMSISESGGRRKKAG